MSKIMIAMVFVFASFINFAKADPGGPGNPYYNSYANCAPYKVMVNGVCTDPLCAKSGLLLITLQGGCSACPAGKFPDNVKHQCVCAAGTSPSGDACVKNGATNPYESSRYNCAPYKVIVNGVCTAPLCAKNGLLLITPQGGCSECPAGKFPDNAKHECVCVAGTVASGNGCVKSGQSPTATAISTITRSVTPVLAPSAVRIAPTR